MSKIITLIVGFLLIISVACYARQQYNKQKDVKVIESEAFRNAIETNKRAIILDVRKPEEFAQGHIKGAINLDWLNQNAFVEGAKQLDKRKILYIYCRSGRRSNAAANYLMQQGFQVYDLRGGILAWQSLGYDVEK